MPALEPLLLAAGLAATALTLLSAGLAGFRLAKHRAAPQREALRIISGLTRDGLKQTAPQSSDRLARAALTRIWALTDPVITRQRQLLEQNGELQRRYGQARALIDLMAEFNETMQLAAVLDRLSFGLSRFFAGDGVAIWIRATEGGFELAVKVAEDFPSSLNPHDRWVATVMAGDAGLILPFWLDREMPCMAAPLLDAQGQRIGIVALTSRRRPAYTAEDGAFLRTVIGLHATWLVNSATHMWGSRRFATRDDSRNCFWVAILTFGEGWHNNHHSHPQSARHGLAWYEIDLNWYGISVLRMLGLAWDVTVPNFRV